MKRVLIIGATSAIATEVARRHAAEQAQLVLAARNAEHLETLAADLRVRGATAVDTFVLDVNDTPRHAALLEFADSRLDGIDILLIAHGTLPDQQACEQDVALTLQEIHTNGLSVIALLTRFANYFEARQQGCLAVISSVAGDRGRQSNYVYGAAKGMVSLFAQGLRNRLADKNVCVLTIKPGFVDTPMTQNFDKGPLWVGPAVIARGICQAIDKRKDVVYLPWFWRFIMLVIRLIPERIFKHLKL